MILIKEELPVRVSGVTSLFISAPYNEETINIIKQCPVAIWDKKKQIWEVPLNSLHFLIDNLTFIDDIKLSIKEDENVYVSECKPVLEYKTKPFQHQIEGIQFGLTHDKWLLLDGMGLGKSFQIINIARELKQQRGLEHCLVICGLNTLKSNWKKEIGIHSDETVRVLGERISKNGRITYTKIPERAKELEEPIKEFFIVTNIETFRSDLVVEAFKKSKNNIDMVVVDEVHKIKNKNSKQGDNLLKIDSKYKIAATGTLLLNNPLDAFVPLKWTDNEHSNLTNFKNLYCRYGGFGGHEVVGFKNLDLLKDEIESCSLRRTKDLLDLPPKTIIEEVLDMSDEQADFYEAIKKGVKEEADKVDLKTSNLLALVTRLRQATSCPSVLTSQNIDSVKVERCVDLVEELVSNNEKVVVFSTFKETVVKLQEALKHYKPLILTGDTKDAETSDIVDRFQTDSRSKVLIGTWQKAGTGITLTAASYMIFLDTPWTDAIFSQACDRIYRIGTKKSVFIYNLICKNTIDERVSFLLKQKKAISDFIIDDDMSESTLSALRNYIEEL